MAVITAAPRPKRIFFPDLIARCPFPLRYNPHCESASAESKVWLMSGCRLSKKKRAAFHGLKGGLLTAMVYPEADYDQFRVCCDWINYLFHLDNICDEMDDRTTVSTAGEIIGALRDPHGFRPASAVGRLTQSFWRRMSATASPGAQRRFIETFELFFRAVAQQARDRASGNIPDLESYIAMRRDTSGCKPCWALIEYANDLDLPDWVMEHPCVRGLEEAANDLVTWSNDIFSYNVEQSNGALPAILSLPRTRADICAHPVLLGDTHNMIVVVQTQEQLDLQSAVDYVGDLCLGCVDRFQTLRDALPSWGPEIDDQLAAYVAGLGDWMIGNLVWSFETERYFGRSGRKVRAALAVALLPRRK
ncbi:Alpha-muurolene synthase [Trametes pubescens]|uniref:Terpene synthase n=1 Tax=Trametes pubescens TaxID=154538 RepID=A0A1M2W358_TRAPU|nr:Alpha-muurolene synthase [Trametes pubescens]